MPQTLPPNCPRCQTITSESATCPKCGFSVKDMNIISWLVVFFPLGLILMWSISNWQQLTKRIVTAVFLIPAVLIMMSFMIYSTTPSGIASKKAQAIADAKQAKQEEATDVTPAPAQTSSDANSDSLNDTSASSSDDGEMRPRQPLALPMTAADRKSAHAMPDSNAYPEDGRVYHARPFPKRLEAQKLAADGSTNAVQLEQQSC